MPTSTAGESINHSVEDLSTAQDFVDKIQSIKDQIQLLVEQKGELKLNRDNNEKMNPAVFKRYSGESVYQEHLTELNDKISDFESQIQDTHQLYKSLGGDKIDSLKAELLERTGGKPRVTWSAEAMITARALEQAERAFEDSYKEYISSQEPDPTGNQGQGKQPAGGSDTKEPITARGVAERLRAGGKYFSLDAYAQALDDEGGNLSPREETLLKELDKAQQEKQALQDTIKALQEELNDIKSRLDQQPDNGLKTKFANINIFERTKRSKEWLKSKWVKIGAGVLATVSLLGLGGGLFAWNNSVESDPMQSSAAAESGDLEETTPIFEQPGANEQNNASATTNESGANKQNDVAEKTDKPTEIQGYSPEDVKAFRDNYGIGEGILPFTSEADAMMRDGQGAFSLENEYAVGEALCSIEVNEGMNARGCYNQLGLAAAHNAQVMAQLIGQERGLDMTAEGYTQEVNAILDQLLNDPEFWSSEYSKYFGQERQVELRIDTDSSRTSHYNIDGRLEVSYGVPPEGAFLIVNNPDGSQTMIRVNCGGQVTVQERVYEIGENSEVKEVPYTPVPWDSTPQKPTPDQPGEQDTPPTQPGTPEEQTPQEPAPKDSSTSIDENSEVPEGNKADAVEADLATGSDAEPSEQPGATYTPPVQEQTEQVAPEAQAPQSERRQAQADQGVEAGNGNQSNSGTVSTN